MLVKKNNNSYSAANAKRSRSKKKRIKSAANDKSVQCAANLFYWIINNLLLFSTLTPIHWSTNFNYLILIIVRFKLLKSKSMGAGGRAFALCIFPLSAFLCAKREVYLEENDRNPCTLNWRTKRRRRSPRSWEKQWRQTSVRQCTYVYIHIKSCKLN